MVFLKAKRSLDDENWSFLEAKGKALCIGNAYNKFMMKKMPSIFVIGKQAYRPFISYTIYTQ